jgi:hypothetical protein
MPTQIQIKLFDGRGLPIARPKKDVLLSVRDGRSQSFHRTFVDTPTVVIDREFHNDMRDSYTILASLKGHRDAGFMPVKMIEHKACEVSLMLLPRRARFEFSDFAGLKGAHARLHGIFTESFDDPPRAYELLRSADREHALACLMNIVEALAIARFTPEQRQKLDDLEPPLAGPVKPSLADYIVRLDTQIHPPERDRFFAWCDADIANVLAHLKDAFHKAPDGLHPGATESYKQVQFGEANVQVTLHGNDVGVDANGVKLMKVEFDIDYFRDSGAHLLIEVFPNFLKRLVLGKDSRERLTDPVSVYGLRWIADRQAATAGQSRPFAPAYTIGPAV